MCVCSSVFFNHFSSNVIKLLSLFMWLWRLSLLNVVTRPSMEIWWPLVAPSAHGAVITSLGTLVRPMDILLSVFRTSLWISILHFMAPPMSLIFIGFQNCRKNKSHNSRLRYPNLNCSYLKILYESLKVFVHLISYSSHYTLFSYILILLVHTSKEIITSTSLVSHYFNWNTNQYSWIYENRWNV